MAKTKHMELPASTGTVLLAFLTFVLIANIGLFWQAELVALVSRVTPSHISLLTNQQEIQSLWAALLGVHAAVGAVAPVLGFTLLTTTINSASRIAPAGAVVAAEVGWSRYLRESLTLLAASIVGVLSAPSALGLGAAGLATTYVVLRTLTIFRKAFELLERQEQFDQAASRYLVGAITAPSVSPLSDQIKLKISKINAELKGNPTRRRPGTITKSLGLGNVRQVSQLLRVNVDAYQILASESKRLGLDLHVEISAIPEFLLRGRTPFFSVSSANLEVSRQGDQAPEEQKPAGIDLRAVDRLQCVLEEVLVYGEGKWVSNFVRAPILVHRHVAAVIYEAIPNQRPFDLEYGLGVLGELADAVGSSKVAGRDVSGLETAQWVVDIPYFVFDQIRDAPRARMDYARELVNFLRKRMWVWFEDERRDSLSRLYLALLAKVFSLFLWTDNRSSEGIALSIRGLAHADQSGRPAVLEMIAKQLIVLFIEKSGKKVLPNKARAIVLKCMAEIVSFSKVANPSVIQFEIAVSALAVCLYMAARDQTYKKHVSDVIEVLFKRRESKLEISAQLGLLAKVDELSDRWKWAWWEIEQKESGAAHFVEMESWLQRAGLVLISMRASELAYLKDNELPLDYVSDRYVSLIDVTGWLSLIPETESRSVAGLRDRFVTLSIRRKELISATIELAPLSPYKAREFVEQELASVSADIKEYQAWISEACKIEPVEDGRSELQYGVSTLLPKECFVSEEFLDTAISMSGSGIGQAVVDHEIESVFEAAVNELSSEGGVVLTDRDPWVYIRDLICEGRTHLWIFGVGVAQYEVWEKLVVVREFAKINGAVVRFDGVRDAVGVPMGILLLEDPSRVVFSRYAPRRDDNPIFEDELPLLDGGIYACVSPISEEMAGDWAAERPPEDRDELLRRYRRSVLFGSRWSYEVRVDQDVRAKFFRLQSDDQVNVEAA